MTRRNPQSWEELGQNASSVLPRSLPTFLPPSPVNGLLLAPEGKAALLYEVQSVKNKTIRESFTSAKPTCQCW